MFYIIGVSHKAQIKNHKAQETEVQKEFRTCLECAIQDLRPLLVAEELSEYALQKLSKEKGIGQESLTRTIAIGAGVAHRFCDPDDQARARIGYVEGSSLIMGIALGDHDHLSNAEINHRAYSIEVGKYWPLREKFWLEQLEDTRDKDVVFVCGDAHIESFQALLKQAGIESTVQKRHIGLTEYDDKFIDAVRTCLRENPELLN